MEEKTEIDNAEAQKKLEISEINKKYSEIKKEIRKKYSEKKKKTFKRNVWNKYIDKSNTVGKCECCSREIECRSFVCGLIKHDQNISIDNIRPICIDCDLAMENQDMFEFKEKYFVKKTRKSVSPVVKDQV